MRRKAKNPEEQFRIAHSRSLVQIDQAVNYRKVRVREPRTPVLVTAIKRRACCRDRLKQAETFMMQGASVAKIGPHPSGSVERRRVFYSDMAGRRFILRFPGQHVVVAALAIMQKSANGSQKI